MINDIQEESKNASESQINKNKKEIEKCNSNIENLKKEMNSLIKNNEAIIAFIDSKKNTLLDEIPKNNKREISKYFIQVKLFYPVLPIS
jgi:phage host-nuclease inhibitor protein Gam